jgi:hypothetical protein
MTTDYDVRRLERQIEDNAKALREAERDIARETPKDFANHAERMKFEAIRAHADPVFQATRTAMPFPSDSENTEAYRLRLACCLLPVAKVREGDLARADSNEARANVVFAKAWEAARRGPLTPIKSIDRTGREITEFVGAKSQWMAPYQKPPMLGRILINDQPQVIGTVPS